MTAYDISVANCAVKLDPSLGLRSDASLVVRYGLIRVALSLIDARSVLSKIREIGGEAYLVPVKYRSPAVSMFAAREIAGRLRAQMLAAGRDLDDLDEARDDLLWWTFRAKDREAISRDVIPGCVSLSVDKLDGHIRTDDEYRAWLELSKAT